MGHSASTPSVRLVMTKNDAGRLIETLIKNRDQLAGVTDDVGKGQRDFLDMTIANLQASVARAP